MLEHVDSFHVSGDFFSSLHLFFIIDHRLLGVLLTESQQGREKSLKCFCRFKHKVRRSRSEDLSHFFFTSSVTSLDLDLIGLLLFLSPDLNQTFAWPVVCGLF